MAKKSYRFSELQPTDCLRQKAVTFFKTLSYEQILSVTPPIEVLEANGQAFLSEGNNRAAVLALRGYKEIDAEFKKLEELPEYFYGFAQEMITFSEQLRQQGIHNVHHLWQTYG